jgi:Domain of unknown function (DUF3597)
MSIIGKIKDAIFGSGRNTSSATSAKQSGGTRKPAQPTTQASAPAQQQQKPAATAAPAAPIDIEAVLTRLQAKNPQELNWRTSIVDLMKLVGLDSSLENRKELARELGYTADTSDSAAMNVWLHKRVMRELAANGGKVPRELTD